jgi:hypothetical protein
MRVPKASAGNERLSKNFSEDLIETHLVVSQIEPADRRTQGSSFPMPCINNTQLSKQTVRPFWRLDRGGHISQVKNINGQSGVWKWRGMSCLAGY